MAEVNPARSGAGSQPQGLPQYQYLITRQLQHLVQNSDIQWEHVPGSVARFKLLLPFCYEQLHWLVEFQRIQGAWLPDFVFSDSTFNPLLPAANAESLGAKVTKWRLEDERQLLGLMKSILRRFTQHQKALIQDAAEGGDRRLQREVESVLGDAAPEGLEVLYIHGQPSKAVLVAHVRELDLSNLQPFLDRNWAVPGEKVPPEAVQKLQKTVYIRAMYTVYSNSPPKISLHMPEHLAALIGNVAMPAWTLRTGFLEFLPMAGASLQGHCNVAGKQAMQRQDLLDELVKTKLGSAIEADKVAARFSVHQMLHDGVEWRVLVDLPQAFPEAMPRLGLEMSRSTQASHVYNNYPWSPRWGCKEMAKRISSFLSGEIKQVSQQGSPRASFEDAYS